MNYYQEPEILNEEIYYVSLRIHYTIFIVTGDINKLLDENTRKKRQMPTRISQASPWRGNHSMSHLGKSFIIHMTD